MINNTKTVWLTLKAENIYYNNLPQSFTLADGSKLVYYPNGKIDNSKGVKKMNSNSYLVQSSYGEVVEITNLSSFCKTLFGTTETTNRAKYVSSFCDMFSGIRKENNVMGWTKYEPHKDNSNDFTEEDTEALELMAA